MGALISKVTSAKSTTSRRRPECLSDHVAQLQRGALPGEVFGDLRCALVTSLIQRIISEGRRDGGGELVLVVPGNQSPGDAGSHDLRHREGVAGHARQSPRKRLHEDLAETLHPRRHDEQVMAVVQPCDLVRRQGPEEPHAVRRGAGQRPRLWPDNGQRDPRVVLAAQDSQRGDDEVAALAAEIPPPDEQQPAARRGALWQRRAQFIATPPIGWAGGEVAV